MAPRHDDDRDRKGQHIERRSVLKLIGSAGVALGSAGVVGSAAGTPVDADTVVNLGDEGLQNGDNIDPYIEQYFTSNTEVRIPAGEYSYSGAGLGGQLSNCALVGSAGGVVFNRPEPEQEVRPTIFAESGTVRLENITIRGQRGQAQSRWRVGAESGARMEVVNVNMPDGTVEQSDSTGIYAGTDHGGTLLVKACYFEGFGNVACYVSDPYEGENGQVVVEDCVFRNTNAAGVRFAPTNSVCRGCYFEATETAPSASGGGVSQRGIKIDDAGTDVVIEDCDFEWGDPGDSCINFHERGEGGSGVVRDVRIRTTENSNSFDTEWDVSGSWTGENINLTEA